MAKIDDWIAEEFRGHGVAVRRQDQPPIAGEPFMSMQVAKHFAKLAYELGQKESAYTAYQRGLYDGHNGGYPGGTTKTLANLKE